MARLYEKLFVIGGRCTPCMLDNLMPGGSYTFRVQNCGPGVSINIWVSDEEFDPSYTDGDWTTEMGNLTPIALGEETIITTTLADGRYDFNLMVGTCDPATAEIDVVVEA